jgi:hypothetical protein
MLRANSDSSWGSPFDSRLFEPKPFDRPWDTGPGDTGDTEDTGDTVKLKLRRQ